MKRQTLRNLLAPYLRRARAAVLALIVKEWWLTMDPVSHQDSTCGHYAVNKQEAEWHEYEHVYKRDQKSANTCSCLCQEQQRIGKC